MKNIDILKAMSFEETARFDRAVTTRCYDRKCTECPFFCNGRCKPEIWLNQDVCGSDWTKFSTAADDARAKGGQP